jgi:hypothetical protein
MMDHIYLTETPNDALGEFTQYWICEPPPSDREYIVTKDRWNSDYSERWILAFRLVDAT